MYILWCEMDELVWNEVRAAYIYMYEWEKQSFRCHFFTPSPLPIAVKHITFGAACFSSLAHLAHHRAPGAHHSPIRFDAGARYFVCELNSNGGQCC